MVVAVAAEEDEEVAHPVRPAEPELLVELRRLLDVVDEVADMSELLRPDRVGAEGVARLDLGVELEAVSLQVLDLEQLRNAGLRVAAPLGGDPCVRELRLRLVERILDLEREMV